MASCVGSTGPAAYCRLFAAATFALGASLAQAADIVDTDVAAGKFNTLVTAVKAAGLADTLKGDGPFKVFAPTDEAFAKLPAGTVESLLNDKEKLAQILTYHVVPGKVMSSDVTTGAVQTVQGQPLNVVVDNGAVKVNEAQVVQADVTASNGVIHVIDSVVLPQ